MCARQPVGGELLKSGAFAGRQISLPPKPKYLRQVERNPLDPGSAIWRTTAWVNPPKRSVAIKVSLVPQCHQGVDSNGATGGSRAGDESDDDQKQRHRRKGQGIGGAYAVQLARECPV